MEHMVVMSTAKPVAAFTAAQQRSIVSYHFLHWHLQKHNQLRLNRRERNLRMLVYLLTQDVAYFNDTKAVVESCGRQSRRNSWAAKAIERRLPCQRRSGRGRCLRARVRVFLQICLPACLMENEELKMQRGLGRGGRAHQLIWLDTVKTQVAPTITHCAGRERRDLREASSWHASWSCGSPTSYLPI
jgi:hypothetical protein